MARVAGLEPAAVALTVRCTTIVLHPNAKMEARMGFEPMYMVLRTVTYSQLGHRAMKFMLLFSFLVHIVFR